MPTGEMASCQRPAGHPPGQVEPAFTWMTDIPDRLRRRLHWTRVPLPPEAKPTILLLYAGKDDAGSLDSYLHAWSRRLTFDETRGPSARTCSRPPSGSGTTFIRWGRPQLPHLEHPPLVPQAQRPEASEWAQ